MENAGAATAQVQLTVIRAFSPIFAAELVRVRGGRELSAAMTIVPVRADVAAKDAVSVGHSDRPTLVVQLLPVVNLEPAKGHQTQKRRCVQG